MKFNEKGKQGSPLKRQLTINSSLKWKSSELLKAKCHEVINDALTQLSWASFCGPYRTAFQLGHARKSPLLRVTESTLLG